MSILLAVWLAAAPVIATDTGRPPGEEQVKAVLDTTPRHGEYVDVPYAGGPALRTFVVYPERKDKAPVVLVLHENVGLSDWIRSVADRLAADGFIAVAPEYEIYEGAGHGFLRQQSARDGANQRAAEKAWPRVVEFLRRQLE